MAPDYTIEQKITEFERAVCRELFDAADYLFQRNPPHALGALRLLVSYFEPIAKYAAGHAKSGSSKSYFVRGCLDVIARRNMSGRGSQPTSQQLEGFYEVGRCGLAHGATLSFNVAISASNYPLAISTDGSRFSVNPKELLALLRADLATYVRNLREPTATVSRQTFQSRWNFEALV